MYGETIPPVAASVKDSARRFAIPTTYQGVHMRSRLEARWAAAFDALHWPWQYEPIDLDGYIPDFIVKLERSILFEVKGPEEELEAAKFKIEMSGWHGEAVLVGGEVSGSRIGEIVDTRNEVGFEWGGCCVFYCISCGLNSLLDDDGSHHCRRCGVREGHRGEFDAQALWIAAGNRVQWKPGA